MLGRNHDFQGPPCEKAVRARPRPGMTTAGMLALAGLLLGSVPVAWAQRVERGTVKQASASAPAEADTFAAGAPANSRTPVPEPAPSMASLINAQPEGWEIYFKTGAVFSLGDGFFEKKIGTGWTTQIGIRQPLYRPAEPWLLFAEFGGGYTANPGLSKRPVTTSGYAFFPNDDHIHFANDFYDTHLVELQRGFVHGVLGMYYYPEGWNSPGERLFHINARAGLRTGGMKAVYFNQVQLGLRTVFDTHAGPMGHGHRPELTQFFSEARDPEWFFGMFGSVGMGVTYYNKNLFGRTFCDITFSLEVEFAHEWFDAGAYGHMDSGFGSYTPMLSVAFSF